MVRHRAAPPGWSLIAYPFSQSNQSYDRILGPRTKCAIYKYVNNTYSVYSFEADLGNAWFPTGGSFTAGEPVYFRNESDATTVIRFAGQVVEGMAGNGIPSGQALRASIVPAKGYLLRDLWFPVTDGDQFQKVTSNSPLQLTTYTYSAGNWSPSEPKVEFGEGFWSIKSGATTWWQNSLISP